MSFIREDFIKLSRDNRLKKTLFAVREFLNGKKDINHASSLLEWLNELEGTDFKIPAGTENWKLLYKSLHGTLQSENPFVEDEPFDKTSKTGIKKNIRVLLDDIRSPHNVGSIFRSCECFGVEEIILAGITPSPENNSKAKKTAMGCEVKYSYHENAAEAALLLKKQGFKIYSVEKTGNSTGIRGLKTETPALVILGNEEFGISRKLLEISDCILHIDMYGFKNSLNVSVACAIALYEFSNA